MNIRLKIVMVAVLVGSQGIAFGGERGRAPSGGEQSSARDSFEISDTQQRVVASRVNSALRTSVAAASSISVRGGARRGNARIRQAQQRDLLKAENAVLLEINAKLMQDNVALGDALYQMIKDNADLHRRLDKALECNGSAYGNENDNKASSASRGARSHSLSPRDYSARDRKNDRRDRSRERYSREESNRGSE